MTDQQRAKDLYLELDYHFWPLVGTVNQIAGNALFDAYDAIEERGLMKMNIKKSAKQAVRLWEVYQKKTHEILGDRWYLWQDVVSIASKKVEDDLLKLYYSIKQAFDNHNLTNSDLRASVFLAQALIEVSVEIFDNVINRYQSKTLLNISADFMMSRMKPVLSCWTAVAEHFAHTGKGINIDLNEDKNVQLSISILLKRFSTPDILNDAAGQAMHLNPDMAKYAAEEDKQFFKPE